jgi:RHS repeat-associated protein
MPRTSTSIPPSSGFSAYGLPMATSWARTHTVANPFLNNSPTETNPTTGWGETHFRTYDPVLARFHQVDPMASKYASLSPYNYAFNNPVTFNDPTGADPYIDALSYGIMISNGGSVGRVQQMRDRRVMDPGFGVYNGAYSTWRGPVYNNETKSHHLVQYHGGKTGYFVNRSHFEAYWDDDVLYTEGVLYPLEWVNVPTHEFYSFRNQVNGYGRAQNGRLYAGLGERGMEAAKLGLYLVGTSNAVNEAYGVKNLADVYRNNKTIIRNNYLGRATNNLPKSVIDAQKGLKLAKAAGRGLARPFFFAGFALSAADVAIDHSASNIAWNIADTVVAGGTLLLAATPVGWVIGVGAAVYFTGRLAYDIYDAYNDGK